jgi:hypothetical protein
MIKRCLSSLRHTQSIIWLSYFSLRLLHRSSINRRHWCLTAWWVIVLEDENVAYIVYVLNYLGSCATILYSKGRIWFCFMHSWSILKSCCWTIVVKVALTPILVIPFNFWSEHELIICLIRLWLYTWVLVSQETRNWNGLPQVFLEGGVTRKHRWGTKTVI